MLRIAIGHSEAVDTSDAICEVLERCTVDLCGHIPGAGILYSAIGYDHSLLLHAIADAFPGLELVGCTTDGEASSGLGFAEDSVALILFVSDDIEMKAGIGHGLSHSPDACGREAGESATRTLQRLPAFLLAFPDGWLGMKIPALKGLQEFFGQTVPVFGGCAAEQAQWTGTYQFYGSEVFQDSMPVLAFSGNIAFSHGVASGWQPLGRKGVVTKASGCTVYEIDHEPALDFYRRYLGQMSMQLREFPFAVFETGSEEYYVLVVQRVNEEEKCITLTIEIPEGSVLQITEATRDQLIQGSRDSVNEALLKYPGDRPELVLFFSCASRKEILGTRTQEEVQVIRSMLGPGKELPVFGFYAYGEIGPRSELNPARLHNGTLVTLLLGSKT